MALGAAAGMASSAGGMDLGAAAECERQSAALEQQWWDKLLDDDDYPVPDAVTEMPIEPSSPQTIAECVAARHRFPAGTFSVYPKLGLKRNCEYIKKIKIRSNYF